MFQRIVREDDKITPLDILKFIRECNAHSYSEVDCFYLVKCYDKNEDGCLSYEEFLQFLQPAKKKNLIKANSVIKVPNEVELLTLFALEFEMHRMVEPLK